MRCALAAVLAASALVTPASALVTPASAQVLCGSREALIATLNSEKYQESRRAFGIVGQSGAGVMELFVSKAGTWTLLMTYAKDATCIVAAGYAWEATPGDVFGQGL